jgi:hypothetical protein
MAAFRRVEDVRAGATALGILVPPGQRTLVILRPRALDWDLLPLRFDRGIYSGFCDFARDEAAALARRVQRGLEEGASPAQVVTNPGGDGYLVWIPVSDLMWIVCARMPGRPYEPVAFASGAEADVAVRRLTPYFWPAADADQEYYFNTQNFKSSR